MINMKEVFYSKIGNHSMGREIVYKVYFGSIDPQFYFAAYVIPRGESYDMFYIPQVNNIADNGIIDMSEDSSTSRMNIQYGEPVEILLTNPFVEGRGSIVSVSVSIDESPVAVNTSSLTQFNLDDARAITREAIQPLIDAKMYLLANIAMIEVETKLRNILESSVGVNQDTAIPTILRSVLAVKKIFIDNLPDGMPEEDEEMFYMLYVRMLNVSPDSNNIPSIFAKGILFANMMYSEGMTAHLIPYEILFRLMIDWSKEYRPEYVYLLKQASDNIEIKRTISVNLSTMEDQSKVYELLNKTQEFVYLTNIRFTNMDNGEYKDFRINNEYFENYIKTTDRCIEQKGIPSEDGTITIQYGYGTDCDSFIGLTSTDNQNVKRGVRRDDKIIDNEFKTARTWQWVNDEIIQIEGDVTTAGTIAVEFTGV